MIHLTLFSLLLATAVALAELPQTLWTRTYGGNNWDAAFSGKPMADGGFVLAGYTQSYGLFGQNMWIVRVNANGDTLYRRFVGGSSSDAAFDVYADLNSVYAVGNTSSYGPNPTNLYLVRLNAAGDTVLTRWFDVTSGTEQGLAIDTASSSSEFYLAGWRDDASGQPNMLLSLVTAGGTVVWTRTLGGVNTDWAFDVLTLPDSGCFLLGQSPLYDNGPNPKDNVFLARYDVNGDTLWTKHYGQSAVEEKGKRMIATSDGNYLIVAATGGLGVQDIFAVKIDPVGNELWSRTYGGGGDDDPGDVSETCDGGFLIGARTDSYGAGNYDIYLIRTDENGDTLWTKTYGGTEDEYCYSVHAQCDGLGNDEGYWAAGYTRSYGVGSADMYLIRLDAEPLLETLGPITCQEYTIGQNFTVTWQSRGNLFNPYVKIELNRDYPSGSWVSLADSTLDDGSETFTATAPASPYCRVRVSFLSGGLSDEAGGNFQIIPTGIFQNPTVQWDSVYNGGAAIPDVVLTSDNNYASNYGISIVKRNTSGGHIWTATFTYDHDHWTEPNTYAITQLTNGNLIAIGKIDTIELTANRPHMILLYADSSGNPLNTIGALAIENFPTVGVDIVTDEAGDGFWALASIYTNPNYYAGILRAPSSGGWADTIRTVPFFPSACALADSDGLLIVGQIGDFFANEVDLFLVRIDSDGDTLWTKRHDLGQSERIQEIRRLGNGNYILVGASNAVLGGPSDYLMVIVDSEGNVIQQWNHNISYNDNTVGVVEDADGGIVITGVSSQLSQINYAHLMKFGCSGGLVWDLPRFSADGREYQKIQRTPDGGFIVCGAIYERNGAGFVATRPNLVKYGPETWTTPPTCPKADSVVIQYLSGAVRLTWIGEETGVYVIYATTSTAESGNPPGNGWTEIGCMEPIPPATAILQWTDTNISATYKRYAIIHECTGSCGGGDD